MKVACTFRIDADVLQFIVAEAARLSVSEGRKVSQAEVIERAFSGESMESIQSPKARKLSRLSVSKSLTRVNRQRQGESKKCGV